VDWWAGATYFSMPAQQQTAAATTLLKAAATNCLPAYLQPWTAVNG